MNAGDSGPLHNQNFDLQIVTEDAIQIIGGASLMRLLKIDSPGGEGFG